LRPSERATGSFVTVGVLNTGSLVTAALRREQITHQTSQAVVGCGFDENLQQGASYFQRCKYLAGMRVIAENFAAKLPPSPQLTVPEHQSSSSRSKNIKSSNKPSKTNKPAHIQNTTIGRKESTFPTQIFNSLLLIQ
jgi:hypothetical protein